MAALSAPSVWEPLYECARQVVVSGFVPGATIDIYATPPGGSGPIRIGGGISLSSTGQVFGVDPSAMVLNARIHATQTFSGSTSPPSPEVVLQRALDVDAPRLSAPLLECARCVRVDGMLPGATAEVRDASMVRGSASAATGAVKVIVSPALAFTDTISARQIYCGTPGPGTPSMGVGQVKEQPVLGTPEVEEPIYACQEIVVVRGCMLGADVRLFVDGTPASATCAGSTAIALRVSGGAVEGTSITAQQSLCNRSIASPVSNPVVVRPADEIPRPAVRGPLYEGDTSVMIAMTVAGEVVTIETDGTQIGMGGTGGGDAELNVEPALIAGQRVTATVELCGVKKTSLSVVVRSRPTPVEKPRVLEPLFACGSLVQVAGCIPGARVRVYATDASRVLLGVTRAFGESVVVGVTPLLHEGWQITATQEVGGVASAESDPVKVLPAPNLSEPHIVAPLHECARCIRVEQVVAGTRVDVYQNDIWIGGADNAADATDVAVYPPLVAGAIITATQSLCGTVSEPGRARVEQAPQELPPPIIEPAHAGDSVVVVGNLVPGATVDVEETSRYKLVIGRACAAAESTRAVWLSLPLFAGASLRARQRLCTISPNSDPATVNQPREWPLGAGLFKAGFRTISAIPVAGGGPPSAIDAIVYYPATIEGENAPFASGAEGPPFHLIVYGHGNRDLTIPACPGSPTDLTGDFHQMSVVLSHLARWGFVTISPDMSAFSGNPLGERELLMRTALNHMLAENGRSGSPFQGKIRPTGITAMGHSTGGGGAIVLGQDSSLGVAVLGLVAPAADQSAIAGVGKPVLVLVGTEDSGGLAANNLPHEIYNAAGPPKHLVDIGGANHFGYTDELCVDGGGDGVATISRADQQRIAYGYLTAFYRRYLHGATDVQDYLIGVRPIEELEGFSIAVQSQL